MFGDETLRPDVQTVARVTRALRGNHGPRPQWPRPGALEARAGEHADRPARECDRRSPESCPLRHLALARCCRNQMRRTASQEPWMQPEKPPLPVGTPVQSMEVSSMECHFPSTAYMQTHKRLTLLGRLSLIREDSSGQGRVQRPMVGATSHGGRGCRGLVSERGPSSASRVTVVPTCAPKNLDRCISMPSRRKPRTWGPTQGFDLEPPCMLRAARRPGVGNRTGARAPSLQGDCRWNETIHAQHLAQADGRTLRRLRAALVIARRTF